MRRKIKILEAIRQGNIGGGESHVLELVRNMDKTLYEPVVLSFTGGPMVDRLKALGIRVEVIETIRPFDHKVWKRVKGFIATEGIDIVHAHGTRAMSNVFTSAKKLSIPLLYTVHGWSFHPDQLYPVKKIRELSERILTKKADHTICVSRSNQVEGVVKLKLRNSSVIYNAVDLEKFNPGFTSNKIRNELKIAGNKTVISYIVRMTSQKDPITMLNAFSIVLKERKDAVLLMVGDGDLKEKSVQHAKKLGIESHVIFQPFRTDIPAILDITDIYCLPSLWEGFPIGIIEAMAMRKSVIASPVGGTRELVRDGSTGLLVEPQNPEQLAKALLLLIQNKKLRKILADNAFNFAVNNFSIHSLVDKVQGVYKELA
ncbi:MAG TPA: glycosyltransferase family 4 protein [Bacteroidales bacterium]|nr:glycosyltransferase family 4 protein [Bacteroidales bacterium]